MDPIAAVQRRVSAALDDQLAAAPIQDKLVFLAAEQAMGRLRAPSPTPRTIKRKSLPSPPALVDPVRPPFFPDRVHFTVPPSPGGDEVTYAARHVGLSKLTAGARRLWRVLTPVGARATSAGRLARYQQPAPPPAVPRLHSLFA